MLLCLLLVLVAEPHFFTSKFYRINSTEILFCPSSPFLDMDIDIAIFLVQGGKVHEVIPM